MSVCLEKNGRGKGEHHTVCKEKNLFIEEEEQTLKIDTKSRMRGGTQGKDYMD